jgi:hypothetical protein
MIKRVYVIEFESELNDGIDIEYYMVFSEDDAITLFNHTHTEATAILNLYPLPYC